MKWEISRRTLALLAAAALLFAMTACGRNATQQTQTTSAEKTTVQKPLVTISLTHGMTLINPEDTDVAKEIEKKLNIKIKYVASDPEKFKVQVAANDLADIISMGYDKKIIDAGVLMPLDDLVNTYGQDIIKGNSERLDYSRKFLSSNTGKLYFILPHALHNIDEWNSVVPIEYYEGAFIRWDYYKELLYPEIKSQDDLLTVLKMMHDKHPKTPEGKKTYGIGFWTDWGLYPIFSLPDETNGFAGWGRAFATLLDYQNNLVENILSDNGRFWEDLMFYYKANKMGILDPESFTMKMDNLKGKVGDGQIFFLHHSFYNSEINTNLAQKFGPEAGMAFMPLANKVVYNAYVDTIGWPGLATAIWSKCSNPDRAMELINYLSSEECVRLVSSGVKGVHWDIVDGKPKMLESTLEQMKSDPDFAKKTGIGGSSSTILSHLLGMDPYIIYADGGRGDLSIDPAMTAKQANQSQMDYSSHYEVTYPGEYASALAKQGKAKIIAYSAALTYSKGDYPEDIARIADRCEDYINKNYPKLIMAKTDDEFNTIKAGFIKDLKDMEIEKIVNWDKDVYAKAKQKFESK